MTGDPGCRTHYSKLHRGPAECASVRALARVATSGYIYRMGSVTIKQAKNQLTALARRAEKGETIVVTRYGKPVFDLVPHRQTGGLNLEVLRAFKRKRGIKIIFSYIAEGFDDPLPEDFLLRPLPKPCGFCSIPTS